MSATKRKRRSKRTLRVTIRRRGGNPNADQYVEALVRECVKRMFSTRMANTLDLTVKLRTTAGFEGKSHTTRGVAQWAKQNDPSRKKYTIVLRRDEWSTWPRTIAHELQHIHQFATGALRYGSKGGRTGWFWRPGPGRAEFIPLEGEGSIKYWNQPWEIDARASEHVGPEAHKVVNAAYEAGELGQRDLRKAG